jgi:Ser/Thr protein kinase RdoA (MazF antagonist)
MENAIKEMFSNEILEDAMQRYGINSEDISFVGGFQNFVYEYRKNDKSYILRLTPSPHRTVDVVKAELDWILYLADEGMSVSRPICSMNGIMTEVINSADLYFTAVSFEKAPGKKSGYPECLQDEGLYEKLGHMTGKLHALSKLYQPRDVIARRRDWKSNYYLRNIDFLPPSHIRVREIYYNLLDKIKALPKTDISYGLIHGDINVGNFLVDEEGKITLFDFDEAQYSWYVEDIAIQLYYLVYVYGGEEGMEKREEQAHRFMKFFMKGYRTENALEDYWLTQIPLFLQLRELIVYIGAYRYFDGDETFSSTENQWFKDWIAESRIRLENDKPIVNIWD